MGVGARAVQRVAQDRIRVAITAVAGGSARLKAENARLALEVSNRGYVMESGEITMNGPAKQLLDEAVAYYQGAYYLYKNGLLKNPKGKAVAQKR